MANDIVPQDENGAGMPVEFDASTITGEEKAAILLLSLNEQDAAGIIRHLEPKQVQRVGSAMARAKDLSQEKVSAVHRTFLEDIQKYTNIGMGSEDFMRNAWWPRWVKTKRTTWLIKFCWVPVRKVWIH